MNGRSGFDASAMSRTLFEAVGLVQYLKFQLLSRCAFARVLGEILAQWTSPASTKRVVKEGGCILQAA